MGAGKLTPRARVGCTGYPSSSAPAHVLTAADFPRTRWGIMALVTLPYWGLLAYQYTHGGVTGHSFLARADMPTISNWWGALTVPLVAYVTTGRVQRRLQAFGTQAAQADTALRVAAAGMVGAALYGAAMAMGFSTGHEEVSSFLFTALPLVALLLPVFRAEYLLGFIAALSMVFGGVLPLIIASGVASLSLLLHATIRRGVRWLWARRAASATAV